MNACKVVQILRPLLRIRHTDVCDLRRQGTSSLSGIHSDLAATRPSAILVLYSVKENTLFDTLVARIAQMTHINFYGLHTSLF